MIRPTGDEGNKLNARPSSGLGMASRGARQQMVEKNLVNEVVASVESLEGDNVELWHVQVQADGPQQQVVPSTVGKA